MTERKSPFGTLRDAANRLSSEVTRHLPEVQSLSLARRAEIPVYIIHGSTDPEDYVFLFDFGAFMSESRQGMFVRPALKLWAGRDDFARRAFARKLRAGFAREFERMEAEKHAELEARGKRSWLSYLPGMELALLAGAGFMQTPVLFMAVTTGRAALGEVQRMLRMVRSDKSHLAELDREVEAKKAEIDAALMDIDISLHRDLYVHAWRGHAPGSLSGLDYDAWPLPAEVAKHLDDGVTRGWW